MSNNNYEAETIHSLKGIVRSKRLRPPTLLQMKQVVKKSAKKRWRHFCAQSTFNIE